VHQAPREGAAEPSGGERHSAAMQGFTWSTCPGSATRLFSPVVRTRDAALAGISSIPASPSPRPDELEDEEPLVYEELLGEVRLEEDRPVRVDPDKRPASSLVVKSLSS
jgi:hypothetical protein